jgi:outer membrane receptor protein involved in Fe transport
VLASWNTPLDGLKASAFYFGQTTHQKDFGLADQPVNLSSDNFPFASPRDHDFGGGNLSLSYDFSWGRLLSSSNRMTKHNYADQHEEFGLGAFANQQANEFMAIFRDDIKGWTQELRLMSPEGGDFTNWEWLVGASFLHYGNSNFQFTWIGQNIDDPKSREDISQAEIAESQVYATADQVASERAFFGEITGRLSEAWEITLGGRQYQTGLLADTVLCGAQTLALFQTLCLPQNFDQKSKGINPKVSVRYVHNRNVQWYWLAAKGFQFGGVQINPPAPGFAQSAQDAGFKFEPYKSSELWNYESGVRTEWLDRRLRFDLTFFYMDWKDLQLTIAVPLEHTTAQFSIIANVGRAHSEGIESALEVLPFTGAKWSTAVCWITAVTDQPIESPSGGTIVTGTRLPGTPKFQWSNVVAYEHAMPYLPTWNIGPVLTHAFNTKGTDALEPTGTVGGYHTLDARIALAKPDSRYLPEFSLGMNNITDVRGATFHVHGGNVQPGGPDYDFTHFVQPRTVLMSFGMKY